MCVSAEPSVRVLQSIHYQVSGTEGKKQGGVVDAGPALCPYSTANIRIAASTFPAPRTDVRSLATWAVPW